MEDNDWQKISNIWMTREMFDWDIYKLSDYLSWDVAICGEDDWLIMAYGQK